MEKKPQEKSTTGRPPATTTSTVKTDDKAKVRAIFDSTKNRTHGAHGIGCRN